MNSCPRILLVEDNADDAELLVETLRQGGCDPVWKRVETEAALRAELAGGGWDVVVSDYVLPNFSGPAALQVLRDVAAEIPAIIVSGTIGEDVAVETLKLGAADYLLKSNLARLVPALNRVLADAENRRQRQRADLALRRNAQIFAQLTEAVLCTDFDERITFWGDGAAQLHGWSAEEMMGRPVGEIFPEKDRAAVAARIANALRTGRFSGEVEVLRKDGTSIWGDLCISPLRDENEQPVGFVGVARDATERRSREEAIRLQERALGEVSQGVLICDDQRNVVYANASFSTITGYARADILGRSWAILQGPETDRGTVQRMQEALDARRPFECVILNYRKDGTKFWNELSISPFDEQPRGPRFIGILRDITRRIAVEEQLRRSTDRTRMAVEASGVGIWELDLRTDEATWDEQMFALYGLSPKTCPPGVERWFQAMEVEDIARSRAILHEALQQGRNTFAIEFPIRRKSDGEKRLIQSMGSVWRDADGRAVRMIGSNRDITEERAREVGLARALQHEKELVREAQAGERAKGEFLAVMSHEIRTPMNGVLGFAELLTQAPDLSVECREYAQAIASSGESLLRILDDVLDFSRLEAGHLQVEEKVFSPREMLADLRVLFAQRALEQGLQLKTEVQSAVPERLLGDAGRLRQVLINLVGNALKFTPEGWVQIVFRCADPAESESRPMFECAVTDCGIGIPPDKLGAIFEPFVQVDSSNTRSRGGTGLGLAISRRLVQRLGGALTAASKPGEWSEFVVRLPLGTPDGPAIPEKAAPVLDATFASRHPLKVLVVEDDRVNLKLIRALLKRLGYEPLAAENGREALELFRSGRPDCVLMDLQMPEMDGIEGAGRIRAMEREWANGAPAFISALTANIFPADRQRCIDAGMNDYLNKPVKLSLLADVLCRASAATGRVIAPP